MTTTTRTVILSYAKRSEGSHPPEGQAARSFDRLRLSQDDNPGNFVMGEP
jgi:hypothetical protein